MSEVPQIIAIGAGNWGKNLIRNFHELSALAGIVEVNPELRTAMHSLYPQIPIFSEIPNPDQFPYQGAVIATPAPSHYQLAKQVLMMGKDVFIEKPMTLATSHSQEIVAIAEAQGNIVMVGHLLLYQPAIVWLKDYISSGAMGRILHIATQRLNLGTVRTTENALWSLGVHDLAVIFYLLDHPPLMELSIWGDRFLPSGQEDSVHLHLHFQGQISAHIHTAWFWHDRLRQTVILGESKMAVYDEVQQTLTVHHRTIDNHLKPKIEGSESIPIASLEPLKLECQHFLESIQNRTPPRSDGHNGISVVSVLEQAQQELNRRYAQRFAQSHSQINT